MSDERDTHSAIGELTDELRLQAWLGQKELNEPSLKTAEAHAEASALARMRDEIRLQLHLGKLDAQDEFEKLESRWRVLMQRDLEPAAEIAATEIEHAAHDVLKQIRDGYHRLLGH
ncbi:MAG: hypothetical protein H6737_24610 [Alphaproteobacteria bacterium]|nr:hypothetical protein [Alphaproteobacteria bacterium]